MSSVWLFGYGSLIWRPDFAYNRSRVAWVDGWVRRFWQGSHDHRGIPEAPGRVVTLIPALGQRCGGLAYEIDVKQAEEIFAALDYREKNGYDRCDATLFFDTAKMESVQGIFYVANEGNHAFLGDSSIRSIAEQIQTSCGPSGSNSEYLRLLAQALRQYEIVDEHVFELERELESLEAGSSRT